nr:PREDICTED: tonsoku-like protein [Bemisia tabaci]
MELPEDRKWKRRKEKASTSGNLPNLYNACKELGEVYQREERFEEALQEYRAAEKIARSIGNKIDIGVANRMIGEVLCCLGEFDQAIEHQKKHLDLSKEEKNLVEEQRALATLGRTYFVKAESYADVDSDERSSALYYSQQYYQESLTICDKLENSIGHMQVMIMKARLYINLGLTLESEQSEKNSNEAIKLYEKAIFLCKKNEFWDELCRGYTVMGTAQFHRKDSAAALRAYDNALKITTKSEDKNQQSSELLLAKAEVLVDIHDLVGAKQVLLKAYKLKNPYPKDREEIARKAKIVVAMCDAEDKLISTSVDDFKVRKELHEKIADGFVALTNYSKAIDHYKKMLQCAESLGQTGKDLIPCYVSLSQTYKDNKQYDLAYKYFEKELLINLDNALEVCKTLMNMAAVLELQKKSMDEVLLVYHQALDEARKANNLNLEVNILKAIIAIHQEHGYDFLNDETKRELENARRKLAAENLNEDHEEEESQEETEEAIEIGADICLSDLTDSEDNEEFDHAVRPVRKRNSRSSNLMKRNEKGETPLHVACERGNLALVKNLIKQGHLLDVQDAAGWLPLHEACNHGHVKVVEELINAGANINDRGGPGCEGITPLHDAASSGHLDVIELLLDHGASPLVRTNKGETVLDCLLECRKRVVVESGHELDPISLAHFESVVERLKLCLEKVGENVQKISKSAKKEEEITKSRKDVFQFRSKEMKKTAAATNDDETVAFEYQETMKALRRPFPQQRKEPIENFKSDAAAAFLGTEEVGNDWLEDDMVDVLQPPKKRSNDLIGNYSYQKSSSIRNQKNVDIDSRRSIDYRHPKKRKRSMSCSSTDSITNGHCHSTERGDAFLSSKSPVANSSNRFGERPFLIEDNSPDFHLSDSESPPGSPELISRSCNKILQQETLTALNSPEVNTNLDNMKSAGIVCTGPEKDSCFNPLQHQCMIFEGSSAEQQLRHRPESSVYEPQRELALEKESSAKQLIKVRIKEELFEITVPHEIGVEKKEHLLTVSWLLQELRSIFICEEGRAPIITLKTQDTIPLSIDDPITFLSENSELLGEVSSWVQVPLLEQYHEICSLKGLDIDPTLIAEILSLCQTTATLEIKNEKLSRIHLDVILTIVARHPLKSLMLSEPLDQNMFEMIAECLSISKDLTVLNLKNTGLSTEELLVLSNVPENVWQNLQYLNLSHNPLRDESFIPLSNIAKSAPNLRYLNIENCDFTSKCVNTVSELFLENLEELNVSYNELQAEGLLAFLRCLEPTKLKSLRLGATGSNTVLRELALFLDGRNLEKLQTIDLSLLSLSDCDIEIFCNSVKGGVNLEYLNLMDNPELTQKSFSLVVRQFQRLKTLLLSGADFGSIDQNDLRKFSYCNLSSSFLQCHAFMKGMDAFTRTRKKTKLEKIEKNGTNYSELCSGLVINLPHLSSAEGEPIFSNQGKVESEINRPSETLQGDVANELDDSFSFDLNDSFENQFLSNNLKKSSGSTQDNNLTHIMASDSSKKGKTLAENNAEPPRSNWDHNFETSLVDCSSKNALFEDSD